MISPRRRAASIARSGFLLPTALAGLLLAAPPAPPRLAAAQTPGEADVTRVFASWNEWQRAYAEMVASMDALEELTARPIASSAELLAVVDAHDRLFRSARGPEDYLYLRLQLDGADEEARSREHLIDETDRRWYGSLSPRFTRVISELGRERIEEWTASHPALARYRFFFRRFFHRAAYPYAEGQEELRALAVISRRQATRVYNAVAVTEAPLVAVTLESGELMEVKPGPPRTVLGGLASAADRRAIDRAWLEALGRRSQTYAALLQGIVEQEKLAARARGFDSALSARLHADAIPADTVRHVIRIAREASAPLRRYHSLRGKALELEEYGLADRFAPLEGAGAEIPFEEARRLIVESSSTLGPGARELVERAFSDAWIDSVERPGKRPNAGATFVAGHPFVLVNYRGSLENLFQLAHEIGHAVHALLAYQAQPHVYSARSTLTSEAVASVFEGVLTDHMIGPAASRQERIGVLELSIQNVLRLFYRPMLDADFELRLYETDQPVTGPALGELYLAVAKDFYGDTVSLQPWDAHGWQRTPHFFTSPLYLGRYGLATAAANLLVPRLTSPDDSEAAAARQAFLELMRAGSSNYPLELLRRAGADLGDPRTSDALVERLASLVDELDRALPAD